MLRRIPAHQLVIDILIAAIAVVLRLAIEWSFDAPLFVVVAFMGAALALARVSPALALAVAWAGALIQVVSATPPDLSNIAILVVLYSTARHGEGATRWLGLASAGAGALVAGLYFGAISVFINQGGGNSLGLTFASATGAFAFGFIGTAVTLGLSWTLGQLVRVAARAREARKQQQIAERMAVVEQERSRIARDMHDVVAHSLAVVIAQADGARYARAADPDSVDAALTTIATTAREALADVRLLLGQLRHQQEAGPQPVLADLHPLLDQLRASGLSVTFASTGTPRDLPAAHQLAIYRIVQEALTNALRHGDPAQETSVTLAWGEHDVHVRVINAARAGATDRTSAGHGIAGMRERALLVGGTLEARMAEGRFTVRASIPVPVGAVA